MKALTVRIAMLALGLTVAGAGAAAAEPAFSASATRMAEQCVKQGGGGCDPTPYPDDDAGCQSDCCAGSICIAVSVIGATGGFQCVDPRQVSAIRHRAEICGWYAIGGCFKTEAKAQRQADKIDPFRVVRTDDVPNFHKGWYCVTNGPTTEANAIFDRYTLQDAGIADAYIKEGCVD